MASNSTYHRVVVTFSDFADCLEVSEISACYLQVDTHLARYEAVIVLDIDREMVTFYFYKMIEVYTCHETVSFSSHLECCEAVILLDICHEMVTFENCFESYEAKIVPGTGHYEAETFS
jgi:hypothetical protein